MAAGQPGQESGCGPSRENAPPPSRISRSKPAREPSAATAAGGGNPAACRASNRAGPTGSPAIAAPTNRRRTMPDQPRCGSRPRAGLPDRGTPEAATPPQRHRHRRALADDQPGGRGSFCGFVRSWRSFGLLGWVSKNNFGVCHSERSEESCSRRDSVRDSFATLRMTGTP